MRYLVIKSLGVTAALLTVVVTIGNWAEAAPAIVRPEMAIRGRAGQRQAEGDLAQNARELKVSEIVSLSSTGETIEVAAALPQDFPRGNNLVRLIGLDEKPGLAYVNHGKRSGDDENIFFMSVTYYRDRVATPAFVLQVQPGTFSITSTTADLPQRIVTLTQRGTGEARKRMIGVADSGKPGLTLEVKEDTKVLCSLETANLRVMRLNHAKDFYTHARPMLKALGAEVLVYPSPAESAQLVMSPAKLEAKDVERVKTILAKLDADSADERDAASKELVATGWRGLLYTANLEKKALTVEQALRVKAFRDELGGLTDEEIAKYRSSQDVLVNCLGVDDDALAAAALVQLETLLGRKIEWSAVTLVERRAAIEKLHETLRK